MTVDQITHVLSHRYFPKAGFHFSSKPTKIYSYFTAFHRRVVLLRGNIFYLKRKILQLKVHSFDETNTSLSNSGVFVD